jgi:exopolyphosphatase/guanosine-5'-triphosphate,3'-diphosphate pyrophosphatase
MPGSGRRVSYADRPGPVAVIDIGSNSLRLVLYDAIDRAPLALFNEKVLCGLGRDLETSGRLSRDGVARALANVERFVALARAAGAVRLDLIATAAVRDAADGPAFVREIERRCGVAVSVIPGSAEGRLSAFGTVSGIPDADGVMADMGGGSVELVPLDRGTPGNADTLPIGPLRLEAYAGNEKRLREAVDGRIATLPWLRPQGRGRSFYLVGGALRALARIHMEQTHYPLHVIQHYTIARAEAEAFLEVAGRMSRKSLEKIASVSKSRAETVPLAAFVLGRLVRAIEPRQIVFSAYGLREGHIFDLLSETERLQDPLLVACRRFGGLVRRFGADQEELFAWAAPVFPESPRRRLLHAAALLSDIAWADHPDYRADQAFLRVLQMPVGGLDHAGRVFLATAIHARYGGDADAAVKAATEVLLPEEERAAARAFGLALRLGYTLSGGAPHLLERARLALDDRSIVLSVPDEAAFRGEAVQRRLDALGRALGRKTAIATLSAPPPRPGPGPAAAPA